MVLNSSAKKLMKKFYDFMEDELERKEHYIHEIHEGEDAEQEILQVLEDDSHFADETIHRLDEVEESERELIERLELEDLERLDEFFSNLRELHERNMEEIEDVSGRYDSAYRKPTDYHAPAPYASKKRSFRKELYRDTLHLYEGLLYESRMIEIYLKVAKALAQEVDEMTQELTMSEKIEKRRDEGKILREEEGDLVEIIEKLEEESLDVEEMAREAAEKLEKNINNTSSTGADLGNVGTLTTVMTDENVRNVQERSIGRSRFSKIRRQMKAYSEEKYGRVENVLEQTRSRLGN
jgi:hypothetical protein